jgi:hypothetical protein
MADVEGTGGLTLVDHATLTQHVPHPDDAGFYDIRYHADRGYLQLRMSGLWDEAIFNRFADAYREAREQVVAAGGVTHMLADATDFGVQPQSIAERFPTLIHSLDVRPGQRTALVVQSLVSRVQARAGGDLVNARYFRTAQDAADWLFSEEA